MLVYNRSINLSALLNADVITIADVFRPVSVRTMFREIHGNTILALSMISYSGQP